MCGKPHIKREFSQRFLIGVSLESTRQTVRLIAEDGFEISAFRKTQPTIMGPAKMVELFCRTGRSRQESQPAVDLVGGLEGSEIVPDFLEEGVFRALFIAYLYPGSFKSG